MGMFNGETDNNEEVVLGGGCFWCTEAIFKMLKGVSSVEPGYAGGWTVHPNYDDVLSGQTGHAEVVKVRYDPEVVSFKDLLTVFFATHDPTSLNRQGNDVGEQYRSVIFCSTEKQKMLAKEFISDLNLSSDIGKPIVTHVHPLIAFHPAENYHKNYFKNHPHEAYCQVVINPKLKKVQEEFADLLKKT